MTEALKLAIRRYADIHADANGFATTPIPGVGMMRSYAPTGLVRAIYKPLVCIVLGGAKQVAAGGTIHGFSAGQSLIVAIDQPIAGRVVRATREDPYLAIAVQLDLVVMWEVVQQLAAPGRPSQSADPTLFIEDTDESLIACAERLVRLLDRPDAIPILRPSIVKEMHYWLLAGRHGAAIRRLTLADGHAGRIARAVAVLRAEFAQPIPVERLAGAAGMSLSSFHQHFKAVTSVSPLQFQKQLRLLEARRLMLAEGISVSRASSEVGYESASQFTREYGRMFGVPPSRDASEIPVAA